MINPQLVSIAETRRHNQLMNIQTERERVQQELARSVIGFSGQPRPAWQTDGLLQVIDQLNTRQARVEALEGEALVAEFASEYA